MNSDPIISTDLEDLLEQKVQARERLLKLPPEEAQRIVDQVLYPQYWQAIDVTVWEESIESN
ncbi:MAG: hypothetical protein HC852_13660 [Acaryochloridaceae cyanobacterium RU_4_10]|nr:hypothetical protein [Acaryochloridaceae cyanobacterium RU_4_10]